MRVDGRRSPTSHVVDWSYCDLTSLDDLKLDPDVEHLILDGNYLDDSIRLPYFSKLRTLSLNNNHISHLEGLCKQLQWSAPLLTHLSLINNPVSPFMKGNFDENADKFYKASVMQYLPQLQFLDSTPLKRKRPIKYTMSPEATPNNEYVNRLAFQLLYGIGFMDNIPDHVDVGRRSEIRDIERTYEGRQSEGNRFIRDQHL